MTWPFSARDLTALDLLNERTGRRTRTRSSSVSREKALRHSAVWACLRLRADLVSSMPVDVFRRIDGVQVEQPKPRVFVTPGGKRLRWKEFVYSTQFDLDSVGNTVGIVTEWDGNRLPGQVELANIDEVTFKGKGSQLEGVRIGRTTYDPDVIWHEKQFTVSGLPVGLSPIANSAMSVNSYLSAQEFAADWFGNSVVPAGHLKNTGKTLDQEQAARHKTNFEASVQAGGVFVSGNDWEYNMLAAKASESQFLEAQEFSVGDVCRFLGVPGDMIDAPVKGSAVTYANITQRNLQLLIMNLGPAIDRREEAWSFGLLPAPRYAKLNTSALLRMDTKTRMESHGLAITNRIYPPSRALDLENMPPLTEEEVAEFATLFPVKAAQPMQGVTP